MLASLVVSFLESIKLIDQKNLRDQKNVEEDWIGKERFAGKMSGEKIDLDGVSVYYEKFGTGDHILFLLPGVLGKLFIALYVIFALILLLFDLLLSQ